MSTHVSVLLMGDYPYFDDLDLDGQLRIVAWEGCESPPLPDARSDSRCGGTYWRSTPGVARTLPGAVNTTLVGDNAVAH